MAAICIDTREPAPVATFSGRTYDLVVEIDGREHWLCAMPVEWSVEYLLARAFPGVPIKHKSRKSGSCALSDTESADFVSNRFD